MAKQGPMTPSQARYLRRLLAYRDRPPTIGRMLRAGFRTHLLLFVVFAATAAPVAAAFGWTGLGVLATSFLSVLLRDVGHMRSAARM